MADQGKWFKLWCSALDDADLENLSIHEWFCWIRLGAYIKRHGKDGKLVLSAPARAILNLFRVTDFPAAIEIMKRFPSCRIGERSSTVTGVTLATVTVDIEYLNWLKYQGDFSNDRVRKFRDKTRHAVTAQEEKRSRRDVEEKRGEDNTLAQAPKSPPSAARFQKPTALEATAYAASIGFRLDGEEFCAHYEARGWKYNRGLPMTDWKSAVVTWKKRCDPSQLIGKAKPQPKAKVPDREPTEAERQEGLKALAEWKKTAKFTEHSVPKATDADIQVEKIKMGISK